MSHFATLSVKIVDLSSLDKAAQKMGLEVVQGTTVRGYQGQTTQADKVYQVGELHGRIYDVGAVKTKEKEGKEPAIYGLVTDQWAVNQITPNLVGKLVQEYNYQRAKKTANLLGHQLIREELPDGSSQVRIKQC